MNELADMLLRFVDGKTEPWEFDDFISSRQTGKLEQFRLELAFLPEKYPTVEGRSFCNDTGIVRIRQIAEEIRSLRSFDDSTEI